MLLIFKRKDKKKGFTLIELLVVVAIILIITGVTWVNFRHFGRTFDMERDIGRMAQNVRRSLDMTMTAEPFVIPAGCRTTNVVVSYGAIFHVGNEFYNRMAYVIDADRTLTTFGTVLCEAIIERVDFEQGRISVINVFTGAAAVSTSSVKTFFTPPHPRTFIGGIVLEGVAPNQRWRSRFDSTEITVLMRDAPERNRSIRINRAGLIEIIHP